MAEMHSQARAFSPYELIPNIHPEKLNVWDVAIPNC